MSKGHIRPAENGRSFVTIELIRAMAGSIGIIGTVPCTCFIGAYLHSNNRK
jgi:uncharacterized membrane protein